MNRVWAPLVSGKKSRLWVLQSFLQQYHNLISYPKTQAKHTEEEAKGHDMRQQQAKGLSFGITEGVKKQVFYDHLDRKG